MFESFLPKGAWRDEDIMQREVTRPACFRSNEASFPLSIYVSLDSVIQLNYRGGCRGNNGPTLSPPCSKKHNPMSSWVQTKRDKVPAWVLFQWPRCGEVASRVPHCTQLVTFFIYCPLRPLRTS